MLAVVSDKLGGEIRPAYSIYFFIFFIELGLTFSLSLTFSPIIIKMI
jgi:hypothetical protein